MFSRFGFVLALVVLLMAQAHQAPESSSDHPESHDHHDHGKDHHDHHDDHNDHDDGHDCGCCDHHHDPEQSFLEATSAALMDACPWLVAGLMLVVGFQALPLPTTWIQAFLSSSTESTCGTAAVCLRAAVLGLCVPLCSCGVLPMASLLRKAGVSTSAITAFVTAAQSAGIDSLFSTIGLLGLQQALVRLAVAMVFAVSAGVAVGTLQAPEASPDPSDQACCGSEHAPKKKHWLRGFVDSVLDSWEDVVPWVFIGVVFTQVCTMYLGEPLAAGQASLRAAITTTTGQAAAPYVEVLVSTVSRSLLFLGVLPMQLCEHGTAAFSAGLLKAGATTGTSFAFLVLAPATNLATIGMIVGGKASLSPVIVARLACTLVFAALCISWLVDALDRQGVLSADLGSAGGSALPSWLYNNALVAAGVLFACCALRRMLGLCSSKPELVHLHKKTQ